MLQLKINFYASLRKISGTKTVEFSFEDGVTVQQILQTVISRYPDMHGQLFEEDGELSRRAHIYISGRSAPLLEKGVDTSILPSDTVDIFPIGHF